MKINPQNLKYELNKDNIDLFKSIETRRRIRTGKVDAIRKRLIKGEYIPVTLPVNKINGIYRIIEGNHRFEAMRILIKKENLAFKINLDLFNNLNEEQEIELFDIYNINSTIPDKNDILQLHIKEIPFYNYLTDEGNHFPAKIGIYQYKNGIKFSTLLNIIYPTLNNKERFVPITILKTQIVDFAKNIKPDDYMIIHSFFLDFITVFGLIDKQNIFLSTPILTPLFNIYYLNLDKFGNEFLKERMKQLISRPEIIQYRAGTSGWDIQQDIRSRMLQVMNKGRSIKLLI
jgi:hypothetical protein